MVTDSRPDETAETIQRRRACRNCDHRWLTAEVPVSYLADLEHRAAAFMDESALAEAMDIFLKALEARGYTITRKDAG